MSWQTELTAMVRTLINDSVKPYQFSDNRIIQTILVAGKYLQFDIVLDRPYTINVINQTITPDPTDDDDEIFTEDIANSSKTSFMFTLFRIL